MAAPVASRMTLATIQGWRRDPVRFVQECLGATPDHWQADALRLFPQGESGTARICLKACAGPGKSTLLAWAGWWFLTTQGDAGEHPKGIALSITADNLRDNLWPELSKWQERSPFLMGIFEKTKERIFAKDHPETWFIAARSFARSADASAQANSLSGLHSRYILYLIDESGDMLPSIGRAAEQGLAGAQIGVAIQAGNPTSLNGLLAESSKGGSWSTITITADPNDAKRTPRVPREWAQEQIDKYGRDNPWVKAYILGLFPPGGINNLLGLEDVQTAMRRSYNEGDFMHAAKVIGVDVARQGDDKSVILRRQGLVSWAPKTLRGATSTQVADAVAMEIEQWQPDGVLIDGTGGYGAGVIDRLRLLGHQVIDVQFGGSPDSPKFANKRAEMWWDMAEWVKTSGALAPSEDMQRDLTSPTYGFNDAGRLLIESKEAMKRRGIPSPDEADALACTFARKIIPRMMMDMRLHDLIAARPAFDPLKNVRDYGHRSHT